ncbi:MAG: lipid-A-disaccharide synthase [Verrucomicrobiota bacterium]
MPPTSFMLIAGEASGDTLAAELVTALKRHPALTAAPFPPRFFGAGGPKMAAAGVELSFDLVSHAVFGVTEVLKDLGKFLRFFDELVALAVRRLPDVIILVDSGGLNLRVAKKLRALLRQRSKTFFDWNPKIVYYVSPQVWASRPGRAYVLADNVDLLISIFPFEKEWYAQRTPSLPVAYVGHPMVDRHASLANRAGDHSGAEPPLVAVLPGSRRQELRHHLPVMLDAIERIHGELPAHFRLILPDPGLAETVRDAIGKRPHISVQTGGLAGTLAEAAAAISKSGTITLECGYFGLPTVVIYKLSWPMYWLARQVVTVRHIAMPNLLAGETIFPELIQGDATPRNIARETLDLLRNPSRRAEVTSKLANVRTQLGSPGAATRAANAIVGLFG